MELVFGCVGIPLSEEMIVGVLALSLIPLVRGDCCLALCLSLLCIDSCCFREELCTPKLYYLNPQWRFPVWEVLCRRYSGNPSV